MQANLMMRFIRGYFRLMFRLAPGLAVRQAFQLFTIPRRRLVRAREAALLAGASGEYLWYDGLRIRLYRWGRSPRRALLVHGWEGHAGNLAGVAAMLVRAGYEVWAFDGPAHGRSEGRRTHLLHFAGLVGRVLAERGPFDLVVGHSFGSAATVKALSGAEPTQQAARVVLLTTPDRLEDILSEFIRTIGIDDAGRRRWLAYVSRRLGQPVEEQQVSRLVDRTGAREVLVVHDEADRVLPFAGAARVGQARPVRLHATRGLGHYRLLWDETVLGLVRDFAARETPVPAKS